MSWSIFGIETATPMSEAKTKVQALVLPPEIKVHISAALDGLEQYFADEPDLHVTITGYGHLCEGKGSYPVTTATLKIERAFP